MRRFITATAAAFALCAPNASGHTYLYEPRQAVSENTTCQTTYTVKAYKQYASRVYKRKVVSQKAHRLMETMHRCQPSFIQRKAVGKHHNRYLTQREALKLDWACTNSNPIACIYLASRKYGTSAAHLISCARSEGGLGPSDYDKMNYEGSGAGGNFQFMRSTHVATIARMGLSPKPWLNARWQAMAAAWKFRVDGTSEWTGPGC